ncbi:hypothetical protein KCP71_13905 [Salmonella enterica subsp. enterica]|nr:hypothetical protein KCP71_13905 [Salmonella enterica subsp. enterica]
MGVSKTGTCINADRPVRRIVQYGGKLAVVEANHAALITHYRLLAQVLLRFYAPLGFAMA